MLSSVFYLLVSFLRKSLFILLADIHNLYRYHALLIQIFHIVVVTEKCLIFRPFSGLNCKPPGKNQIISLCFSPKANKQYCGSACSTGGMIFLDNFFPKPWEWFFYTLGEWFFVSCTVNIRWYLVKNAGVYIVQFDHFPPPPSFEIIFFPRRISLRRAVRSPLIFGVYDPKRCIFKAFSPVFYVIFDE